MMFSRLCTVGVVTLALTGAAMAVESAPRDRILFNEDWRFQKDDPKEISNTLNYFKNPVVKDAVIASSTATGVTNAKRKLDQITPYTLVQYDDASWRKIILPHDWGIEGPFDQRLRGETGKLPWTGIGWYRKIFPIPAADAGRQFYLDIDGAMAFSTV